ncbi:Carbon-nitrogen hydrolase [Lambiella insularis]|nr:Carbon-nitrogen hydrolase [Lambiella insularis]
MHIAILQFSPVLGAVEHNIARADELLRTANTEGVDLLVLPELAFSGYNHPSLASISPHLEPTASGTTASWAFRTAARLHCLVCVGYPERATPPPPPPNPSPPTPAATHPTTHPNNQPPESTATHPPSILVDDTSAARTAPHAHNYNALLVAGPPAAPLAHYRKAHLYYTDTTWARPGGAGFLTQALPLPSPHAAPPPPPSRSPPTDPASPGPTLATAAPRTTVRTAVGICMDLNPARFAAPWGAYEFAAHARAQRAELVVCCMAWLTRLEARELGWPGKEEVGRREEGERGRERIGLRPDGATLRYWVERLRPLVRAEREVVVVLANRCGVEAGGGKGGEEGLGEGGDGQGGGVGTAEARYAGSSTVMCVGRGRVRLWGIMGRGEEGVLRVDTETECAFEYMVEEEEDSEYEGVD